MESQSDKTIPTARKFPRLLACLLVLLLLIVFGQSWLTRQIMIFGILNADVPNDTTFAELALSEEDPSDFLTLAWDTGKVPQRRLVATLIHQQSHKNPRLLTNMLPIMLAGGLDADASVRDLMLHALVLSGQPEWREMARIQLRDPDPALRIVGLDMIRRTRATNLIPDTAQLMDDPDIDVTARAGTTLSYLTGVDFGLRGRDILEFAGLTDQGRYTNHRQFELGLNAAKAWWTDNSPTTTTNPPPLQPVQPERRQRFHHLTFSDLDGNPVRLDHFKGRPTLLTYWATWCPECAAVVLQLNELVDRLGTRIAIVGVSLDALPLSCTLESHGEHENGHDQPAMLKEAVDSAVGKLKLAAKERAIHFPLLLDADGENTAPLYGNEIPTFVLLSPEGELLRRFHGYRDANAMESIIRRFLPDLFPGNQSAGNEE